MDNGGKVGFYVNKYSTKRVQKTEEKSDCSSQPAQPPKKCPECNSTLVWKDGLRYTKKGDIQRYLCRSCGYRFSESEKKVNVTRQFSEASHSRKNVSNSVIRSSDFAFKEQFNRTSLSRSENVTSHGKSPNFTGIAKHLKKLPYYDSKCRVCVSDGEMKNLAEVKTQTKNGLAGATNTDTKSQLFNFAWWMKKEGYAPSTITTRERLLRTLAKHGANLDNPESIKEAIAKQDWCNKRKMNGADAYTAYLRMQNKTWNPPRYRYAQKIPYIPKEKELDALIAGCGPKTSTFLQMLKETAMRAGEAHQVNWNDIDFERATIRVTPEKGSNPRIFKISNKLKNMLLHIKSKSKSNHIFSKHLRTQRRLFQNQRKKLSRKLQNPKLLLIHFHTFRHWKATMLCHQTNGNLYYVKKFLGHKNIKNTENYIHLAEVIFSNEEPEYICQPATTAEEAKKLIENGFRFECEMNGTTLFKKIK